MKPQAATLRATAEVAGGVDQAAGSLHQQEGGEVADQVADNPDMTAAKWAMEREEISR